MNNLSFIIIKMQENNFDGYYDDQQYPVADPALEQKQEYLRVQIIE